MAPIIDSAAGDQRAVYRTGLVIIAIALVMGAAFATSYVLALGRPTARNIPVGVVGANSSTALAALQSGTKGGLRVTHYATLDQASEAIEQQRIDAVVDDSGSASRLLLSSASGASVARTLRQVADQLGPRYRLAVVDIHPLPTADPQGLTAFYVTLAATILGFVTMFQLRANLDAVSLRSWLVLLGGLAVATGGVLTTVADLGLGSLHGPFLEMWLLLSAQCAVAALFNSTMLVLIGRWAILPTWTLFIVLGNTSSGGAVASALLPRPYALLSRCLPTGATVSGLHTAAYFRHHQHAQPFVVLGLWLVGSAAALVVLSRVRGRTPVD